MERFIKTRILTIAGGVLLLSSFAPCARAQYLENISIGPKAIDIEAEAGDLIEKSVSITNIGTMKTEVNTSVEDSGSIPEGEEEMPVATSTPKESLGNWISFFRGSIELEGGELRQYPLKIKIDKKAPPGRYLANLVFSDVRRSEKLLISLKVKKDLVESAELNAFRSMQNIYFRLPAYFTYSITNSGNSDLSINGKIRIYDRQGQSIEDIAVDSKQVGNKEKRSFEASWYPNSAFGKYKAVLDLEYGNGSKRDIQDTIFFWVLPVRILAVFAAVCVGTLLLFFLIIFFVFRRRRTKTGDE